MILLHSGTIVDGTGAPAFAGGVLLDGERIAAVGRVEKPAECETIDCAGLTIAPGFIDLHSHSDLQVLENRAEKTAQGVTTEVVGNCGFSAHPCGAHADLVRDYGNGILHGADEWQWADARAYLADAERQAKLTNVLTLVGHGTLRVSRVGHRQGALDEDDLAAMERALEESLGGGAAGFSTGLMYAPGSSAPPEELQRLTKVVARRGAIYTTHMRSYAWDLLESIDEQIGLARESGCRLEISHLQAVGRANWPKQEQALERLEAAARAGVDVAFDSYPYLAGSTVLTQLLPQWTLAGGTDELLALLSGPRRADILREMEDGLAQQWTDIFISSVDSAQNRESVGRSIAEISTQRGSAPADVVADLLIEERCGVQMLSFNQSEHNLRALLTHPMCNVISDGFYVKGRPHPRLFGTFPRLLGEYVRRKRWLTLEEAVHKMTGQPAARFRMQGRGVLQAGAYADVTVFDAARVDSPATYDSPQLPPQGIAQVYRQGRPIHAAG